MAGLRVDVWRRQARDGPGHAWRIGGAGDAAVGARLAKLGPAWRVSHAVPDSDPCPDAVPDPGPDQAQDSGPEHGRAFGHMAIGPGGVFTVSAQHHPRSTVWVGGDTFLVDGVRLPYVGHSRLAALRAGDLLSAAIGFSVAVTGVIAVTGAKKGGLLIRQQPADRQVLVVEHKQLHSRLARCPEVLSVEHVRAIYEAARRATTWHGPQAAGDR